MSKCHLEHPTQSTACGTASTATTLTPAEFDAAPDEVACKACKRTLAASRAGRKAYRSDMRGLTLTISSELADVRRRLTGQCKTSRIIRYRRPPADHDLGSKITLARKRR
jgi:ribosomal protein S27E